MNTTLAKNGTHTRPQGNRQPDLWTKDLFGGELSRWLGNNFWGSDLMRSTGIETPVNIRETDTSYELELIAPGLKKNDFKISLDRNLLTVGFEHAETENQEQQQKQSAEENKGRFLRREYRYQSFRRSFNLDDSIDTQQIKASYEDGVLRLLLPKKEEAQRLVRQIDIE